MQDMLTNWTRPIEDAATAPTAPSEAKTLWDDGHCFNRAERRRAMKDHMTREQRLKAFGLPAHHRKAGR